VLPDRAAGPIGIIKIFKMRQQCPARELLGRAPGAPGAARKYPFRFWRQINGQHDALPSTQKTTPARNLRALQEAKIDSL
jgi:hypothetical protein